LAIRTKLQFRGVSKEYEGPGKGRLLAVDEITLSVAEREFVTVIGSSGCGKTTLLKLAAGLIAPTRGAVVFDDVPLDDINLRCGYVPQSYALFPWLTVYENVAFGLRLRLADESVVGGAVSKLLEEIGLVEFSRYYPKELSGGMNQRVALARALAHDPDILLMDEPFGSLDSQTRVLMQDSLLETWTVHMKTVLFVTHDIEEAVYLSDRIVILGARPGRVVRTLNVPFRRPRSRELRRTSEFGEIVDGVEDTMADPMSKAVRAALPRRSS
jgi:NitT/TauT family transport system ATP-binding protein